MIGESDRQDRNESRKIAIVLVALVGLLILGVALALPVIVEIATVHFEPGLGLRSAAIIAFFVTVVLMLVLTVAAGDGLLGELQYILGAFFLFYLIFWLMIAWIF